MNPDYFDGNVNFLGRKKKESFMTFKRECVYLDFSFPACQEKCRIYFFAINVVCALSTSSSTKYVLQRAV